MAVVVRDAVPEDEDRLRMLFAAGMADAHAHQPELYETTVKGYTEHNLQEDFADITKNYVHKERSAYLVAVIDGTVVGGVGLHPVEVADAGYALTLTDTARESTAELRRMTVDANYRNQGIAKALIQHFEEVALRFGYNTIHLTTGKVMEKAWVMYERRGFVCIEEFTVGSPTSGGQAGYPVKRYSKTISAARL